MLPRPRFFPLVLSVGFEAAYQQARRAAWSQARVHLVQGASRGQGAEIVDDAFRLGEAAYGGDHLRNSCFIDELALWDSDETANAAAIYNSGTTHDLAILGSAPTHYWRMGDEDTFPTIEDNVGSLDFTMFNMTSSDIVTDVP